MKKSIKFFSLVMLFMFIAPQVYSQKCKFDYEKKDPLTGEATKGNSFMIKMWWHLGLNKVGNEYHVGMYIRLDGNVRDYVTPENTIIFKLENGEIITVYADNEYVPTAQSVRYGNEYRVVSVIRAKFTISEEDLQKIATSPLAYVKMTAGARTYDSEFKTKKGAEFQNKAKCILQ